MYGFHQSCLSREKGMGSQGSQIGERRHMRICIENRRGNKSQSRTPGEGHREGCEWGCKVGEHGENSGREESITDKCSHYVQSRR